MISTSYLIFVCALFLLNGSFKRPISIIAIIWLPFAAAFAVCEKLYFVSDEIKHTGVFITFALLAIIFADIGLKYGSLRTMTSTTFRKIGVIIFIVSIIFMISAGKM